VKRNYADWIQKYLEFARFSEAPTKFHFWTAVSVIAGALQRKVWIDQKYFQWLPNFYIVFVSPPGIVSKSTTAAIGMDLLRLVPGVKFGPSSLTWQSLVTALAEAPEAFELPGGEGEMLVQSAITIVASELGSLLDLKDRVMVDVLVDLWDGKKGAWEKWTKTSGNDKIENPFINIIGCTTPAWIQENFSKYLLGGGFTSRTVFVYAQEKRQLVAYPAKQFDKAHEEMRPKLLQDLEMIKLLVGEYRLNKEAEDWGTEWYVKHNSRMAGADPTDEGLNSFLARKQTFLHKLGMVLAASRRNELTIFREDLEFADAMLTAIESELATVFGRVSERDEVKDVMDVLRVLHAFKKLPKSVLYRKLFTRMSADQFEGALKAVIAAKRATLLIQGADVIVTLIEEKSDGKENPDPLAGRV
jgi:hypothetical protein